MFFEEVCLDCFLKFSTNVIALISVGILFQSLGPYTLNECTANVFASCRELSTDDHYCHLI